jgi:hypothetical protein
LVDSDGLQRWFPNPKDIDAVADKGTRIFDGEYEGVWEFVPTNDWKDGQYIAFTGLYEDTYDLPTVNRRLVTYYQQNVEIK